MGRPGLVNFFMTRRYSPMKNIRDSNMDKNTFVYAPEYDVHG
jgi:hypothetical protein